MNTKLLLLLVIIISIFSFNSNLTTANLDVTAGTGSNLTISGSASPTTAFYGIVQRNNTNVRFNLSVIWTTAAANFSVVNITLPGPNNFTFKTSGLDFNRTGNENGTGMVGVDGHANATNGSGSWAFGNSTDADSGLFNLWWNNTDNGTRVGHYIFSFNLTVDNLSGPAVDDSQQKWNVTIYMADSTSAKNSTVMYTYVDSLSPRLWLINVSDGNATLVNGSAYGFGEINDGVTTVDHISNKSATVYTTVNETNGVNGINMYYICNSSYGEANVTYDAYYRNVSMTTGDTVGPFLYTGTMDLPSCVDTANNATTFLFTVRDNVGNYINVSDYTPDEVAEEDHPFTFNVVGNGSLPVIFEVNITDQSRTLRLRNNGLRGGNDYLSSNSRMDINVDVRGRGFAADSDGANQSFFYIINTTTESNTKFEDWYAEGLLIGLLNISGDIVGRDGGYEDSNTTQFNGTIPKGVINDTDGTSGTATGNFTNFLVLINDSLDYTQAFFGVFVVDGGDPTAKITSPADTNINVLNSIKYGCSGTDSVSGIAECKVSVTKPDGTVVSRTSSNCADQTFTNTDTNLPGTYSVECTVTDSVGYTSAKQTGTFAASTSAGTSGGTGGGSSGGGSGISRSGEELTLDADLSTSSDVSFTGSAGETKVFSLSGGDAHTVTFVKVTDDAVTITIESYKAEVTLGIGETKDVDMDGDGTPNVQVTLESITNGVAKISVVKLSDIAPEEETEQEPSTEEETEEIPVESGVTETGLSLWTWVVLLAVLVLVGFVVFRVMKRK